MMPVLVAGAGGGVVSLVIPTSHEYEVGRVVVGTVAVTVVYLHAGHVVAEVVHHLAVFQCVPVAHGLRVAGAPDLDVPSGGDPPTIEDP